MEKNRVRKREKVRGRTSVCMHTGGGGVQFLAYVLVLLNKLGAL